MYEEEKKRMKTIRWGVIGSGWIAHMFADTVRDMEGIELVGVYSSNPANREAFRQEYQLPLAFESVDELIRSDQTDCIYVGTPHDRHREMILRSIEAGKHVLCAKPMSLTEEEVAEIQQKGLEKQVLVMEEMWTGFRPLFREVRELIQSGGIGELVKFEGHCSFRTEFDQESRLFRKSCGGGSMLDVGVYVAALAQYFTGQDPCEIKAAGAVGKTGVDHMINVLLSYPDGVQGFLSSGMMSDERQEFYLAGTKGSVTIPRFWYTDRYIIEIYNDEKKEVVAEPLEPGKREERHDYLIQAFCDLVREGKLDNEIVPAENTRKTARIMDEALRQVGVVYTRESA